MRYAHTVEQVRAAEAALMATLPPGTLMQRAATGVAHAVIEFLGGAYGRRVVLLVGPGDNGGDALFAGALMARRGVQVEALLLFDRAHEAGLAAFRAAGGRVGAPRPLRAGAVDAVVDGVLGIGGRPGVPAHVAEAVIPIDSSIPFVAVDVPSGVDVDTGARHRGEMTLRADLTVTFGTYKVAHLVDPAAAGCGVVQLVDIGLGPHLGAAPVESLQAADVAALIRRPMPDAQKYTRGVVGLRTGSERYPGAALLSVAGANTGLAGMVRYVGSADSVVKQHHPEVVGEGRVQAWVVGSGTDDQAQAQLEAARADRVPVVVDADALRFAWPGDAVWTPHAGELASILGRDRGAIESQPLASVREIAERDDVVVLLKGRRTLIARPDGKVRVNTTGTPWLATAGAGDVLAGLIGALLATGLDPFDAASAGAWIHGAAATLASAGGPLTATQVSSAIQPVVRDLLA